MSDNKEGNQPVNLNAGVTPTLPVLPPPPPTKPVQTPELPKESLEHQFTMVKGVLYNSKGYRVCGVLNQHNKPCQRIGKCPFHSGKDTGKIEYPKHLKFNSSDEVIKKKPYKKGWSKEEHFRFLTGLKIHGKGAWKEIAQIVKTRSSTQIQSHAQKYFARQKQLNKSKKSIHDYTLNDLKDVNVRDTLNMGFGQGKVRASHPFVNSPNPPVDMSQFVTFFTNSMIQNPPSAGAANANQHQHQPPPHQSYVPQTNHLHPQYGVNNSTGGANPQNQQTRYMMPQQMNQQPGQGYHPQPQQMNQSMGIMQQNHQGNRYIGQQGYYGGMMNPQYSQHYGVNISQQQQEIQTQQNTQMNQSRNAPPPPPPPTIPQLQGNGGDLVGATRKEGTPVNLNMLPSKTPNIEVVANKTPTDSVLGKRKRVDDSEEPKDGEPPNKKLKVD